MLSIVFIVVSVLRSSRFGQRGQGLAEYARILGLIAMIAIPALMFIGEFWSMPDLTATPQQIDT